MMSPLSDQDRWALHDLVCRFQQSFDTKDWPLMRACLADRLWCDYSSFRAVPADWIEADRYVRQRETALSHLAMQHSFLNLRVNAAPDGAEGRCNYVIHRFHPEHSTERPLFFHSYGHYRFGFARGWRIASITQVLLKNWGDPELHGATRSVDNVKNV